MLINPSDGDESRLDYDAVTALPMVADMSRMTPCRCVHGQPYESIDELFLGTAHHGHGRWFDGPLRPTRSLCGPSPEPRLAREIVIERNYAASEDLEVGDTMTIRIFRRRYLAKPSKRWTPVTSTPALHS